MVENIQVKMQPVLGEKAKRDRFNYGDRVHYLQHTFPFPKDLYGCRGIYLGPRDNQIDTGEARVCFEDDPYGVITIVEERALERISWVE